jgi:hypothetical protein
MRACAAAAIATIALFAAASGAVPAASVAKASPAARLLAIDFERLQGVRSGVNSSWTSFLVRVDPLTLRHSGRRIEIGAGALISSFSPDRSRVAIGTERGIRIVDLRRWRLVGDVRTGSSPTALAWLEPRALVGVDNGGVFRVDPSTRRVVVRQPLEGSVERWQQTRYGLVVVVAPAAEVGPARVALISSGGVPRFATIDRVRIGSDRVSREQPEAPVESRGPGLAVDEEGGRAFLVLPDDPVAEIDLRTLAVEYHSLVEATAVRRVAIRARPAARAKSISGPWRYARSLGNGLIAVSGWDTGLVVEGGHQRAAQKAAGLKLIDTARWTTRTLEPRASQFTLAGTLLLAYGAWWSASTNKPQGMGLTAYDLTGNELFHLFGEEKVWAARTAGRYTYVEVGDVTKVVDLETRRVLRTIAIPLPWALPRLLEVRA